MFSAIASLCVEARSLPLPELIRTCNCATNSASPDFSTTQLLYTMNRLSQQIEWHRLAHSRAGEAVNIRLMVCGEEFFLLTRDLFATREGGAFWSAATGRRFSFCGNT
jgi:hypothetical protein